VLPEFTRIADSVLPESPPVVSIPHRHFKAKENPKTVQGILGHARIQTILDLYADEDLDEMIAAQEKFLDSVGFEEGSVQ
jgi:hypothetical protein